MGDLSATVEVYKPDGLEVGFVMEDIATHARKLRMRYVRSPKAEEVIGSARQLARLVLQDASLLKPHRNQILSLVQWYVSQADGKYATRYRSKCVVKLAEQKPTSGVKINHEHVLTLKAMNERLRAEPHRIDELLDEVIGCIVTKAEHSRLKHSRLKGEGWIRYKNAGIEVLDMSTDPPSPVHNAG